MTIKVRVKIFLWMLAATLVVGISALSLHDGTSTPAQIIGDGLKGAIFAGVLVCLKIAREKDPLKKLIVAIWTRKQKPISPDEPKQ